MIYVKDFSGITEAVKIQNAINAAALPTSPSKTVMLEEKDYYLESSLTLLNDVELLFGYRSRLVIGGNFPVLLIGRNASVTNPFIAVDAPTFDSPVFYLDGKNKYYNTWNKTAIKDGVVLNWTGSHKGVGIRFYSGGTDHEISFVDTSNIKLVGLRKGIELEAKAPATGMAWVNANRFNNISIEDCVEMITIDSSETIPNECSGNIFSGLQLQPSTATTKVLKVSGQHNRFDGMLWDISLIPTSKFVDITANSSYTKIDFNRSLPSTKVQDNGASTILL
ncbi:polygalacturonase [Bacillus phage vB_BanH_Abinadi]|nr:polygalacturonase [Bacillus phage vB_BanH_Abinadi]